MLDATLSCALLGQCLAEGRWHDQGKGPSASPADVLRGRTSEAATRRQENGHAPRGGRGSGKAPAAPLAVVVGAEWATRGADEGSPTACRTISISISTRHPEGEVALSTGQVGSSTGPKVRPWYRTQAMLSSTKTTTAPADSHSPDFRPSSSRHTGW